MPEPVKAIASFKKGDVVQLNSGGPKMVIVNDTPLDCECKWHGQSGELYAHFFPAAALRVPVEDKPPVKPDDKPKQGV